MLSKFPVNLYLLPDLSVSVYSPVIGDPERQPVKPLPAAAAEVAEVPAVELVPGVVWLPGAWFVGSPPTMRTAGKLWVSRQDAVRPFWPASDCAKVT